MSTARPTGHATVLPFLMHEQMDRLLEFAKKNFGAEEVYRLTHENGKIWHAQLRIGDSVIMAGDTMGQHPAMPINLYVYVDDADAAYDSAIQDGATSIAEPALQFYGDRVAGVRDFAGNNWWLASHQEDLSHDEMTRRAKQWRREQTSA